MEYRDERAGHGSAALGLDVPFSCLTASSNKRLQDHSLMEHGVYVPDWSGRGGPVSLREAGQDCVHCT